jgi:hypothetical protein
MHVRNGTCARDRVVLVVFSGEETFGSQKALIGLPQQRNLPLLDELIRRLVVLENSRTVRQQSLIQR